MPSIPLAVSPSVKTPGLYITVNLLGALANAGDLTHRALIIAPKGSAGNITDQTEVRQVFGPDDVALSHGPGTQAHLAAKKYFAANPGGPVDVVAPTASAGVVATATQTFTGPATENSVIRFRGAGRLIDVAWNSGEAATTFVPRAVAALNAEGADLPFVASDATLGSLLSTAKVAGLWGNDILINASILSGGTGIAITVNPASLTGGTLEPTLTTVLALVATRKYRRIVPCCSNSDAESASSTSGPGRVETHIDTLETGNEAKLQVGVIGHTGTIANVKAGAIAKNNEAMQYVFGQTFEGLPCELAGAEAGDALKFVTQRANFNRIGNVLDVLGPADPVGEKPTAAEVEDLLSNGVTPLNIQPLTGEIYVVRPITTHSLNGSTPDYRAFDMSDTDGMYSVVEDLQATLPQEFANCSITEDLPPGVNRLPPGVVERKDVEAFVLNRLGKQVDLGVVDSNRLDQSIAAGELIVQINSTDPTQVDIFLPAKIVKPLAKFGLTASKVA
jgi:phage tail sheath gpL-like